MHKQINALEEFCSQTRDSHKQVKDWSILLKKLADPIAGHLDSWGTEAVRNDDMLPEAPVFWTLLR